MLRVSAQDYEKHQRSTPAMADLVARICQHKSLGPTTTQASTKVITSCDHDGGLLNLPMHEILGRTSALE